MLSKQLKAQLRKELPSGITFRGDNALWVKRSKSYVKDGEKKRTYFNQDNKTRC